MRILAVKSIDVIRSRRCSGLPLFQGLPERTGIEGQFHDSLTQPQIFRFEKRKETYWLGPGFNIIPLMRFRLPPRKKKTVPEDFAYVGQ